MDMYKVLVKIRKQLPGWMAVHQLFLFHTPEIPKERLYLHPQINIFINRGFVPHIVNNLWQLELDCKDTERKEKLSSM